MYEDLVNLLRELHPEEFSNSWWDFAFACQQAMHEAADAIEELQQQVEHYHGCMNDWFEAAQEYKAQIPRWIPVKEQLIHSGWYLVACNEWGGSAVRKAIYDEATRKWLEFPCGGPKDITKFVAHWMPLPQGPGEE